jgi:hypothetical protein
VKKIIPVSVLLFIALGIISWLFINPQTSIERSEAMRLMNNALDLSVEEEIFYWKESRNWMGVYNKFYDVNKKKSESELAEAKAASGYFKTDGTPAYPDKFIFRVVDVYGQKIEEGNSGNYIPLRENNKIVDYCFFIREEMSYGQRSGNSTTFSAENRVIYNKILGANGNQLYRYYDAANSPASYTYVNPDFKSGSVGNADSWNGYTKTNEILSVDIEEYFTDVLKGQYGLSAMLSEMVLLNTLENSDDSSFEYMDFDIDESKTTSNYSNKGKPIVTNLVFGITDAYFAAYTADTGLDKTTSIFSGADYVSIELLHGKIAQIKCYIRDLAPALGIFKSPYEPYTLNITYLGPKIYKPVWSDDWYNKLNDQY